VNREPEFAEKEIRFRCDDHCHICGLEFMENEPYLRQDCREVKGKNNLHFVLTVHETCMVKENLH